MYPVVKAASVYCQSTTEKSKNPDSGRFDQRSRHKDGCLIRKAFREEIPNTTKIIIAQRVSSIEDADQIIVLDGGQIMGIGTSEELLKTNEIYREVYESQVKGGDDHE